MTDHAAMNCETCAMISRPVITGAFVCLLGSAAVDAADGATAPRTLLQPPKTTIASPITDRWSVRGSYQQPTVNTALRYDASPVLQGTELSGEEELGWDHRLNQGSFEMIVRMLERHRLRMDFFSLNRGAAVEMTRTIRFGDDVYRVSDRVESDSQLRFLGLTYAYSLVRSERVELGLGVGVHLFQVDGHAAVPARRLEERFDAAGPLPTLALDGTVRLTKRFSLNAHAQYVSANIQDVDGDFGIYHADLQFRPWANLAFGLGYTKTTFDIDSTDASFSGRLFLDVKGPEAFVRVSL